MKRTAIQYLAFDVHQATTVACLRSEAGKVVMEATIPTEAAAIVRLVRSYDNLVEDATRVMQRVKALFRARALATKGHGVYRASEREAWLYQPARDTVATTTHAALVDLAGIASTERVVKPDGSYASLRPFG